MEYRCPKCDAVLTFDKDKYMCEYCKSEYNPEYFNGAIKPEYIIPFKVSKNKAIKIYNSNIKSESLTPAIFKKKKVISTIKGVYVPCYLYSIDSTGVVEYEGSKVSTWKSKGINYKKTDVHKIIRGGNISLKDMPIIMCNDIKVSIFDKIEPFDYSKLETFNDSYLFKYKAYKYDKVKEKMLDDIQSKTKEAFREVTSKDIKDYKDIKDKDNMINIYNPKRKYILVPVWILNINYKRKKYTYIINGQTGKFYGDIPIDKKKIIYIWILLFVFIFIILSLLNILAGGII